jgi:hypothetical protein
LPDFGPKVKKDKIFHIFVSRAFRVDAGSSLSEKAQKKERAYNSLQNRQKKKTIFVFGLI